MEGWIEYLFVFFIGSAVGSFLNVVIYRVPRGESIVKPGSHCPQCNRSIKPWENIPVLSYIFLGGRCAGCRCHISARYPIIESVMGGLAVLLLFHFGWERDFLIFAVLTAVLLALSVIDIQTLRLPNSIVLTGAIIGIVLTIALKRDWWLDMIAGGAAGLGLLGLMGLIGTLLFRKPALGMGDIKLAGMIGLYLGPMRTMGMFVLGVFSAAIISGLLLLFARRKWDQKLPFGPYLALGAVVSLLWGEKLWAWYLALAIR